MMPLDLQLVALLIAWGMAMKAAGAARWSLTGTTLQLIAIGYVWAVWT